MNEHDLKINAGDLVFGADGEPELLAGVAVIAQDVRHRMRASGLAADLVADDAPQASVLAALAFAIESDTRIRPGTAAATPAPNGEITITAQTLEGTTISETLNLGMTA